MSAVDPEVPPDLDDSGLAACDGRAPHDAITEDAAESEDEDADGVPEERTTTKRWPPHRLALLIGLVTLTALGGLTGWLGYRFVNYHHATERRAEFVRVARQGAVNLTTIDWQRADADIQRILDSTTGPFYDDFVKRSKPFVDLVKQVQSKSRGTITAAGLQSFTGDGGRVLVAVNVETTTNDAAQPRQKAWRMRIDVKQVGNSVKLSNVEFVP